MKVCNVLYKLHLYFFIWVIISDRQLPKFTENTHKLHKIAYKMSNQTVISSFQESKKVRVSRDLWPWPDLDLEHNLDAGSPGDHRVQVWWQSGHLSARRSDLRKSLQTDGETNGRTDDGRRAIALAHSWNELKLFAGVAEGGTWKWNSAMVVGEVCSLWVFFF